MIRKLTAILACASFVAAMSVSTRSLSATDPGAAQIASRYAAWAGGKANADALVTGLANGSTIMLMTRADNVRSLAGFAPQGPLSPEEIDAALATAQRTLASLGIRRPSADQIQAALIGGEIELGDGRTRQVQGAVALRESPFVSPVAAR